MSKKSEEYGKHLREVCERHRKLPLADQRRQGRKERTSQPSTISEGEA